MLPVVLAMLPLAATESHTLTTGDFVLAGGAGWIGGHGVPTNFTALRSGNSGQNTTATLTMVLAPNATLTEIAFSYSYDTGYGPSGIGATLSLAVSPTGPSLYTSPHLTDYPYNKNPSNYSPPVEVRVGGLSVTGDGKRGLALEFSNYGRNLQVLVPLTLNITCTGPAKCLAPPEGPAEVFMKGDAVEGDSRLYNCFRIPNLLTLPSGTLLAFAEGRADGCKPDVNRNRPIVVRSSRDEGKTWGPIRIAGPALPNVGTNYPGAFLRGNSSVGLRYLLSNGSVFYTSSNDEGDTWTPPEEATQPPGVKCGSAWPKMLGSDVVIPCGGGSARSSDGGRTWVASRQNISLSANVTGIGEKMAVPDGRSPKSLSMFIRASSHNGGLNHAIALSDDAGDTWGPASLLPIVGATCEGSIGRDPRAPPGVVILASISGHSRLYLGRGNMSVFTLDTGAGADPVSVVDVWKDAAGYSDQAVSKSGTPLLLFEGGGTVYDFGMKIVPLNVTK